MNKKVGIAALKSRLSYYLKGVRRGHTVIVYDRDTPVAVLSPIARGPAQTLTIREPKPGAGRFGDYVPPRLSQKIDVDIVAILQEERDDRW